MSYPSRIICLTEESVETLYLLGKGSSIQGVSEYVERPPEAKGLPQVTQFIRADVERIVAMGPHLILGFSDLQKDIARELIGRGQNVFITNQRTLPEILNYILLLGRMVGAAPEAEALVEGFQRKLLETRKKFPPKRPRVYFEEWDHPRLSGISWVSELIEAAGGENVFKHKSGAFGVDRKVSDEEIIAANPDIIFGCWCGKPVKIDAIAKRPGYEAISAVKNHHIWELPPAVFLQPGPALFVDGLDIMSEYFEKFSCP